MLDMLEHGLGGSPVSDVLNDPESIGMILTVMRPRLTGSIAATVSELLDNPDRLLRDTSIWKGWPSESKQADDAS
jgi:hypothetical protein